MKSINIKRDPSPIERYHTMANRQRRIRLTVAAVFGVIILAGVVAVARADDSVAVTAAKIESHEMAIVDTFSLLPADAEEVAKNAALSEFLAHFDAGWAVAAQDCDKACWMALADDLTYDFDSIRFDSTFHDTKVSN
jgi:hypothetical protein